MKKHTEDCLDANDDTSVLKGKCICNEAPEECKTGHTPTPLDNVCIVQKYSDSNRVLELRKEFNDSEAFIVRSVNSHEALLDVAKMVLTWTGVLTSEDKLKIENAIRQATLE